MSGTVASLFGFLNVVNVPVHFALRIVSLFGAIAPRQHVIVFCVYQRYCSCGVHIFAYYQFRSASLPLLHDDFECLRVARVPCFDVLQLRGAWWRARVTFLLV